MKLTKTEMNQLFIDLSWIILECKFIYYEGSKYKMKPISDEKYDKYEITYKKLAKALKLEPTACSYVGFPSDKPCGKLVFEKLVSMKKPPMKIKKRPATK